MKDIDISHLVKDDNNLHSKPVQSDKIAQLEAEIFRLKSVLDSVPGSVYWKQYDENADGIYSGRNIYAAEKMYKDGLESFIDRDFIVGKSDFDILPNDIAENFRKHDKQVIANGQEVQVEESAILPDGDVITQLSTKRPLRDKEGNIVGIVGNTIDISHLKKVEEDLRKAKEEAEFANKTKSEFINNMEHDIRTPFTGLSGFITYLWKHETDEQKKMLLYNAKACVKELLEYCNSILDFSKIDAGYLPVVSKKFNLREYVNKVIAMETPAIINKNLSFSCDIADNVPQVVVSDAYRLTRILINLISNSIKFTNKGGIKIIVKKAASITKREVVLQFIIEDTGVGIPYDEQDFIYEKFTRVNVSNKGSYKGMGLGLSVVKQFVQDMDGEVDLESTVGKGSTFTCTFPFRLPLINKD